MPTYAYRCPTCGHEYEKMQKISDRTRTKCPQCGTRGERMISGGAGFVFKGSGFYVTDYKRAGEAKSRDEKPSEAKSKEEKPTKGDGGSSKSEGKERKQSTRKQEPGSDD